MISTSKVAKYYKRMRNASALSDGSTGRGMSRGAEARDIAPLPSYNSAPHTRPQILIHYKYTPELRSRMLLGETPCLNRTTDGACVCMCVYETRWNIVGRQNNVEKMSGSVFKRYQVSRLELWRGGGRAAAALNTRSVSALLTALIHVAENPLLPPGYRKEQTCKATFGDVWHGQLTIYKSALYKSIKTTLLMGV